MLILTLLTGLALLVLLLFLGWALSRIDDALEGVVRNLEKIAMGVRAIERESAPLKPHVSNLNNSLKVVAEGFESIEQGLRRLA
jgi:uncharacterized protein YoxC